MKNIKTITIENRILKNKEDARKGKIITFTAFTLFMTGMLFFAYFMS